jgi:vacuolar-type H+-ATPase subunit E/Vma4
MEERRLLDGIIKQAEEDSRKIQERAERTIVEKNEALVTRKARMTAETDSKISKKLIEIEKHADSAVKSEKRRKKLKKREEINAVVIEMFYSKIEKNIGTESYDAFLSKIIAEGVIAVDEDEVEVSCSFREKLSPAIIAEAATLVKTHTGRAVTISFNSDGKASAQGVTVKSKNGRINFSNILSSRLRRFDEDIKQIIFDELNKE